MTPVRVDAVTDIALPHSALMTILHGVSHVLMTPKGAALLKELKEINKKY